MFMLVIVVFTGWAALDLLPWFDPIAADDPAHAHALYLAIGRCLAALLTLVVLLYVERPLRRELWLARHGESASGQLLTVHRPRRRRSPMTISYTFRTAGGATVGGSCPLPRRVRAHVLTPGMPIEVLVDPSDSQRHKPRIAFGYVEFASVSA